MLFSVADTGRMSRADRVRPYALMARAGWTRVLALCMAVALSLMLMTAAGHHHDSSIERHDCAVCAVLMDELPGTGSLPPLAAGAPRLSYLLCVAVAHVCLYRCPLLMPPSCGPPLSSSAN